MVLRIFVILALAFMLMPLISITLFSFHETSALTFPFTGFSLRWYKELLNNAPLFEALKTSLTIATLVTVATVFLGLGFSLMWLRLKSRGRTFLELLCIVPIALPGLFIGVALLIFFAEIRLDRSWLSIAIAHILLALPILAITMRARLALYDATLDEAARDLGASELNVFFYVTLPLIGPYIFACGLLAFAISFDEFILTFFVSGVETTMPMFIWSMMRRTVTPIINAISTVTLLITIAALFLAWLLTRTRHWGKER